MFITLEGIEGAGKTTQLDNMVVYLRSRGFVCHTTREPGGTVIGARIRGILLDPDHHGLDPYAELLLYMADRVQHMRSVILPRLAEGEVVLCDRFFDATLVYQGYARGLDRNLIRDLHRLVCQDLKPDLTLLFDLDPEVGLERAWREIDSGGRAGRESRFEQEKIDFHRRVRQGYLDLAGREPHRFRRIDAQRSPGKISEEINAVLAEFIAGRSLT